MGAGLAWATALTLLIAGVVALQDLGVSVGPALGTFVKGVVHILAHPL
ncbi:MAG TPA: hypothetical protein VFF67_08215 [Thermoplasmata archaeon]|nr:hypothetical protein [Thermoplasmata archaeon]